MTPKSTNRRVATWAASALAVVFLAACQTTVAEKPQAQPAAVEPATLDDAAAAAARKKRVQEESASGY